MTAEPVITSAPQGADVLVQRAGGVGCVGGASDGARLELERACTGLHRALLQGPQTHLSRLETACTCAQHSAAENTVIVLLK